MKNKKFIKKNTSWNHGGASEKIHPRFSRRTSGRISEGIFGGIYEGITKGILRTIVTYVLLKRDFLEKNPQ